MRPSSATILCILENIDWIASIMRPTRAYRYIYLENWGSDESPFVREEVPRDDEDVRIAVKVPKATWAFRPDPTICQDIFQRLRTRPFVRVEYERTLSDILEAIMTGNKNITVGDEDEPEGEDLCRQEHADKPASSPKRFREEESNVDDRESKKRHLQDTGTSPDAGDQAVIIDLPGDEVPAEYPNPFLGYKASAPKVKGFIITGHPGIGKTIFFYYVFLLRLQASQPAILITHPDKATVFLQQGIFSISMVDFEEVVNPIPISTWCLVDCSESLESVPEAIVKTLFFILQTATLSKHLQLQNKALGILQYVMKPFSLSELIIGRNRSLDISETPSEESLREHYRQYTPSARFAYQHAGNLDKYRTFVQSLVGRWTIDHLKTLVGAFPTNVDSVSEQTLYHILTVTVEAGGQRSISKVDIASRYISQLITEQLQPSPTVGATTPGCCPFGVELHELLAMASQQKILSWT